MAFSPASRSARFSSEAVRCTVARARDSSAREAIDLGLEGTRIDLEEHLAAADDRALLERHGGDEAGHARPDVDRVHRLEAAGDLVPLGDVAGHDLGHGDLGAAAVRPAVPPGGRSR